MKYIYTCCLIMAALLISCKDEDADDSIAPMINSMLLNGAEDAVVQAGDTLKVALNVSDDKELSELIIEVHENFDGHSHEKANLVWSSSTILQLGGTEQNVELGLPCPMNAASGNYHIEAMILDKSANRSAVKIGSVEVQSPGQPTLDFSGMSDLKAGEKISVNFEVADDVDIEHIKAALILVKADGEEEVGEHEVDLDDSGDTSYSFSHTFEVVAEAGQEYELLVVVKDSDGNHTLQHVDLEVQ